MQAGQRPPSLLMKHRRDGRYPQAAMRIYQIFFFLLLAVRTQWAASFLEKQYQTGSMAQSVAAVRDCATQKPEKYFWGVLSLRLGEVSLIERVHRLCSARRTRV